MKKTRPKSILVTGGARSGKSAYAQQTAEKQGGRVLFCATAQALDDEMRARIHAHRESRPCGWDTLEAPINVAAQLEKSCAHYDTILVDCITLLVANCLGDGQPPAEAKKRALQEIRALASLLKKKDCNYILVTNEVGQGIVPDNALARLYRDVLGRANQILAAQADEVYLMTAGLPLRIKTKEAGAQPRPGD